MICCLNFSLTEFYKEGTLNYMFVADDAVHLSVADSFRKYSDFMFLFQFSCPHYSSFCPKNVEELHKHSFMPPANYSDKGPLFYVLLGSLYHVFDVPQEKIHLTGLYFNTLLISIFLILFFISKKLIISIF